MLADGEFYFSKQALLFVCILNNTTQFYSLLTVMLIKWNCCLFVRTSHESIFLVQQSSGHCLMLFAQNRMKVAIARQHASFASVLTSLPREFWPCNWSLLGYKKAVNNIFIAINIRQMSIFLQFLIFHVLPLKACVLNQS